MKLTLQNHIIDQAKFCPSPNYNPRPEGTEIDLVVTHCISLPPESSCTEDIVDFFQNKLDCSKHDYYKEIEQLQVSSHLLIDRLGNLYQFVPFDQRAWHAGESSFHGRSNCNDFSIGIELEGTDVDLFTDEQYQALNNVLTLLSFNYSSLANKYITGHSDIAPGRKSDPGIGFDWSKVDWIKS